MLGTEGDLEGLYVTARSQYAYFDPARKNAAFMENAGGSQVLLLRVEASTRQTCCTQTCCMSHRASLCGSEAGTACCEMAGMLPPQVPICVADAVRDHLLHNCAQLGAGYALSKRADAAVGAAHEVVKARLLALSPI